MKAKALICAAFSSALLCITPIMQTAAAAAEPFGIVVPLYDIADDVDSKLWLDGTTAHFSSDAESSDAVVEIVAVQTLEKQGLLWIWGAYGDKTWTKTVNRSRISMSNTKSGLTKGKYRLKTEFTFTDEYGKSTTITDYSNEVSVS